jgi:hypothetical protein
MADTQDCTISLAIAGLHVSLAGHSGWAQHIVGVTEVPAPVFSMNAQAPYLGEIGALQRLSVPPTSEAGALYQFNGHPNTAVVWLLESGSGSLAALNGSKTDSWGRAWAVYTSGGYTGPIEIEVFYVS